MYINSTRYTTCSVNVSWEFWEVVLCQFYKFYNGGMSLLKKNIPHFLLFSGSTCTFFGTDFVTHSSHIMMFSFSEGSSVVGNLLFLQLLHVLYMQDISLSLHTLACTMSLGEDVATIPNSLQNWDMESLSMKICHGKSPCCLSRLSCEISGNFFDFHQICPLLQSKLHLGERSG